MFWKLQRYIKTLTNLFLMYLLCSLVSELLPGRGHAQKICGLQSAQLWYRQRLLRQTPWRAGYVRGGDALQRQCNGRWAMISYLKDDNLICKCWFLNYLNNFDFQISYFIICYMHPGIMINIFKMLFNSTDPYFKEAIRNQQADPTITSGSCSSAATEEMQQPLQPGAALQRKIF